MSELVKNVLSVLAFLAQAYPEVATWLKLLADGDAKVVDQLRKALPQDSESAEFLRKHGGK